METTFKHEIYEYIFSMKLYNNSTCQLQLLSVALLQREEGAESVWTGCFSGKSEVVEQKIFCGSEMA